MKRLVVEGETDVSFFRRLLKGIPNGADVQISPPGTFGRQNTVTVLPQLLPALIGQLEAGQVTHLGIVADADHTSGGGSAARWQALTHVLREHGYHAPQTLPQLPNLGSHFRHPDGLPSIGLWLMPDHQSNGMLEDLIFNSITDDAGQQALLEHAQRSIHALPQQLFSPHQQTKATIYTWLAWQRRPGLGLSVVLDPSAALIDPSKQPLQGLRRWLEQTFT